MTFNILQFLPLVLYMAQLQRQEQEVRDASPKLSSYDAYFETVQSRKMLPRPLQENLTFAFSKVPVSSFQGVPGGKGT